MKIIMYATNKDGDGHVIEIGRFDNIQDIKIRIAMFASDVVISFEYEDEGEDE